MNVKSKPNNAPEGMHYRKCRKCSGTGIFAMWVENGIPMSTTGTTCWTCNGIGWKLFKSPNRKSRRNLTVVCPKCGTTPDITDDGKFVKHNGFAHDKGGYWGSDPCENVEMPQ